MSRSTPTKNELEQFERYVFEMDDVLEDFIRTASDQGVKLDYSLESLDALEELLVLTWRDGDAG